MVPAILAVSLALNPVPVATPSPTPSPKPPKIHKTGGSIYSYDAAGQTLTLKTSKGLETFWLAPEVQVWIGTRSVSVEDLGANVGFKVAVSYYQATKDGKKRFATSIRVTPDSTKPKT